MSLFQLGNFRLHSGAVSGWKIECDALTDADWDALAVMVWELVPVYGVVEGVPRGGLPLAERMHQWRTPDGPVLIVDDVLTSGGSMEEQRAGRRATGVVVFARGACPSWVTPLFQMTVGVEGKPVTRETRWDYEHRHFDATLDALRVAPPDAVAEALGWERVPRSDCGNADCPAFATYGPCEHVAYDYRPPEAMRQTDDGGAT